MLDLTIAMFASAGMTMFLVGLMVAVMAGLEKLDK